jgi:hypothetical protein
VGVSVCESVYVFAGGPATGGVFTRERYTADEKLIDSVTYYQTDDKTAITVTGYTQKPDNSQIQEFTATTRRC